MNHESPVSFEDLVAARPRVYERLTPTPLLRHPLLDEWLGCQVWVKHENHLPTGSFKVRGGVNLVAQLTADERRRGVVSASASRSWRRARAGDTSIPPTSRT